MKIDEGGTYAIWIEEGWLRVRRETEKRLTEWHIVLARATSPEPPVIEAESNTNRFALSYCDGRYFIREDREMLIAMREPKRGLNGAWGNVGFSPDRYKLHGLASTQQYPPMLQSWAGEKGYVVTSCAGPTERQYDCVVRLSPKTNETAFSYDCMTRQRRVSCGKSWLTDDGELLAAQRTLKAMIELEVGEPAPPLAARTFEDKPLDLADFRGKYVLLDFWATWCTPCIAEFPHLKETYEAFRDDGRLVMIGLSLDNEIAAPKKLVASRAVRWVQVLLEKGSASPIARAYRLRGIPAIFLIGPDGKILAKDLRGEKIRDAVAEALGKR